VTQGRCVLGRQSQNAKGAIPCECNMTSALFGAKAGLGCLAVLLTKSLAEPVAPWQGSLCSQGGAKFPTGGMRTVIRKPASGPGFRGDKQIW